MICIVALGNPGTEYEHTRHNIGWMVLDACIDMHQVSKKTQSAKCAGMIASGMLYGKDITMLFPTTFMNNSGTSVRKCIEVQGQPEMLIVVHDEIDIPFGEVKVSYDRGAGGHNGVKSIIDAIGPTFVRIRVGVGQKNILGMLRRPSGEALSKFVLGNLKPGEIKEVSSIAKRVDRALELLLTKGVEDAMQEINAH